MTSILRPILVLGGLCLLTTACATTTDATKSVTERASFDLGCPADQLEIVPLPGGAHGVRGCGVRATYVFADPECRSARMMTSRDFEDSCTPTLDFKGHDGHASKEGKVWDKADKKAHEHLEKAHDHKDKAHDHKDKAHDHKDKADKEADKEADKADD